MIESTHMRASPSGKAPASQASIRGFESRRPLHDLLGPFGAFFMPRDGGWRRCVANRACRAEDAKGQNHRCRTVISSRDTRCFCLAPQADTPPPSCDICPQGRALFRRTKRNGRPHANADRARRRTKAEGRPHTARNPSRQHSTASQPAHAARNPTPKPPLPKSFQHSWLRWPKMGNKVSCGQIDATTPARAARHPPQLERLVPRSRRKAST